MIEVEQAPVPAALDVSALPGFMLNIQKLLASRLWAKSTGDEFKAAVALWAAAWQQVPAGSLPNDDRELESHSRAGARWKKIRAVALHGFVLCTADGLLYHPVVCADALRADKARQQRRDAIAKRYAKESNHDKGTGNGTDEATAEATAVGQSKPPRTTDTRQDETGREERKKDSDANASGAARAVDPAKRVFDVGKELLGRYAIKPNSAGGIITDWRKRKSDADLMSILLEAGSKERENIVAYITGCVNAGQEKANGSSVETSAEHNARVLAGVRELRRTRGSQGVVPGDRGDGDPLLAAVSGE